MPAKETMVLLGDFNARIGNEIMLNNALIRNVPIQMGNEW